MPDASVVSGRGAARSTSPRTHQGLREQPLSLIAVASVAMSQPDRVDRYGTPNVAVKVLWSLVALAMIAVGALWTFAGSGAAAAFGPIVAGLGVALGYVVLIQKRR